MAGGIAIVLGNKAAVRRTNLAGLVRGLVGAAMACVLISVGGGAGVEARNAELSDAEFQRWLRALQPDLTKQGISARTTARAFSGLSLDRRILELLVNQPEHNRSAGSYVASLVSSRRIFAGRDKLDAHQALLTRVAKRYGVEPTVVLAIWGVETSFGRIRGKSGVIRSLATLASSDTRRPAFWTKELVAALKILETRDVDVGSMTGSWAGAMGHTQFMPTTYHAFAVDFDGDGRRDIWETLDDALASTANYLMKSGWKAGEPWGFEVMLPEGFDYSLGAPGKGRAVGAWRERGVVPARGLGWPQISGELNLVLPSGASGPAFLVGGNFKAIKRYNPSTLYALAVGQLADRIAGAPDLRVAWPSDDVGLSRTERFELQALLGALYLDLGEPDGIIGRKTRAAIFAFQRENGLVQDGHANKALLARLRRQSGARRASGETGGTRVIGTTYR